MSNMKNPTLLQALFPLIILIAAAASSVLYWKAGMYIPLVAGIAATALLGIYLGYKWSDLEQFLKDGVSRALLPLFILFIIGMIVGTWIQSGVIPTLIYYALEIINPNIFIPTVAFTTGILSIATGSAFTSIATIGLAFMVVGQGMGFPPALVAGAVISGAYFGDKLSPLSDTTNVAPAIVDTDLFSHVKHMLWDTIPAFVVSLVIYYILGLKFAGDSVNLQQVTEIMSTLDQTFSIHPLLLLLPALTIYLVIKRYPVIPTLVLVSVLGCIIAVGFQGSTLTQVIQTLTNGYKAETGLKAVDSLLNRGGIRSMFDIVGLIILATSLGGILEGTGVFRSILNSFIQKARTTGSLILLTLSSIFVVAFASGAQFLSIILPGRAFVGTYKERGLDTKNLSRCLEAAGTVGINLVPWSVNALFAFNMLGVSPGEFIPFSFFIILVPLVNIIYGITGFSIAKKTYLETPSAYAPGTQLKRVEAGI